MLVYKMCEYFKEKVIFQVVMQISAPPNKINYDDLSITTQ